MIQITFPNGDVFTLDEQVVVNWKMAKHLNVDYKVVKQSYRCGNTALEIPMDRWKEDPESLLKFARNELSWEEIKPFARKEPEDPHEEMWGEAEVALV